MTIRHVKYKELMQVFHDEVVRCQGLVRALLVVTRNEVVLPSRLAHSGVKHASAAIFAQELLPAQAPSGLVLSAPAAVADHGLGEDGSGTSGAPRGVFAGDTYCGH